MLTPSHARSLTQNAVFVSFTAGPVEVMGDSILDMFGPQRELWSIAAGSAIKAGVPWVRARARAATQSRAAAADPAIPFAPPRARAAPKPLPLLPTPSPPPQVVNTDYPAGAGPSLLMAMHDMVNRKTAKARRARGAVHVWRAVHMWRPVHMWRAGV